MTQPPRNWTLKEVALFAGVDVPAVVAVADRLGINVRNYPGTETGRHVSAHEAKLILAGIRRTRRSPAC